MIDDVTGKLIEVKCDGTSGPYIIVPESQASKVRNLFKANNISFNENARSITGPKDADTVFDLGDGADIKRIQFILDGVL